MCQLHFYSHIRIFKYNIQIIPVGYIEHRNMALSNKEIFLIFALWIPQSEATGLSSE